jgi:hypothetical protein
MPCSGLRWLVFGYPNATTWIANAMAIDGSLTAHSQRPSPHALSVVTCHLHGGRRFNRALGAGSIPCPSPACAVQKILPPAAMGIGV